jgi:hypothetical protein
MNNPDYISESLETIFVLKILKFFDVDLGSGMEKFGSGIQYGKKFGSGINIRNTVFFCLLLILINVL